MNCEEFKGMDPGGGRLKRKKFPNLTLDARVYQEASNLLPPLDPPQPPPMPTEPVVVYVPQCRFISRKCKRGTSQYKCGVLRRPTLAFPRKGGRDSKKMYK